jgi:4a-hydroxytetrahydrobiopterin dehydratase
MAGYHERHTPHGTRLATQERDPNQASRLTLKVQWSTIMTLLKDSQISEALASLSGWTHREKRLEKEFEFEGFPDTIAFLVRLAFDAEAADHHPDVSIHYRRLTLSYWTHSEGGVTANDVEGAKKAQAIFER